MIAITYIIYQISHLFIISSYFELSSIAIYLIIVDPFYLVLFDDKDELIFLQLHLISTISSQILIFKTQNISSMLLGYFLMQMLKHLKIHFNDKIISFYKAILNNTLWKPTEDEAYDEEMRNNLKSNITLNDDKEFTIINSNTRMLGLIIADVVNVLAMIPYLGNMILHDILIEKKEDNLLNKQIFCMMLLSSFLLDKLNYCIMIKTSQMKHGMNI